MKNKAAMSMQTKKIIVLLTFVFIVLLLLLRVGWIQFVKGEEYQKGAFEQQNRGRIIPAKRGTIFDRNGQILAISATVEQVSVNPNAILDQGKVLAKANKGTVEDYQIKIAKGLSEFLQLNYDDILKKIKKSGSYQEIKRKVEVDIGQKVREWRNENEIIGVNIDEDVKRYYPNENLASHVIGFTGKDDQGLVCGIESSFDTLLSGKAGRIISEVDAKGRELPYNEEKRIEPENGTNIVSTIDINIQYIVEKVLEQAIIDYKVTEGAACIVMDPNNGEILAMASKPDFNLNTPYECPPGLDPATWKGNNQESIKALSETVWRNKALTDTYEPGSTFKAITASAALEEGIVTPETMFSDAPLQLSGWAMRCWRREGHGTETFRQAVENSCNPIFAKVALQMGRPAFYKYVEAFGMRSKTGIQLSGEANSIFHTDPQDIDMCVSAFGQRIQITPLQLVSAYSAIANGGNLLQPKIVKELTDDNNTVIKRYDTKVIRQVISKETSTTMLDILEGVVSKGTGKNAYVKGYRIAGKTGTSQTLQTPTTGRYIVSFCGIAPVDNPQITVLLIMDHTNTGNESGGTLAAPTAGKIFEQVLEYLKVERRYTESDKVELRVDKYVPSVINRTAAEAITIMKKENLTYKIVGDVNNPNAVIQDQMPRVGANIPEKSTVILYTSKDSTKKQVVMPDLKGYTLEDAYNKLLALGINMKAYNSGVVLTQSIPAGEQVEEGAVVELRFVSYDVE